MRSRLVELACVLLIITPALAKGIFSRGGGGLSRGGGGHSYPASTGYSGSSGARRPQTHTYPHSTGGSGHGTGTYSRDTAYGNNFKHTSVHHHYHYSPPQHIQYGNTHYPTYHGAPPTYVYHYRESGSRFDTLLTGLALYNLAMMSTHHSSHGYGHGYNEHRPAGEQCKLGVRRDTGEYEENRVDCRLLTSMMLDADTQTNTVTKTVTTNVVYDADVAPNMNGTRNATSVTTEAVSVKGPSIDVTPGMQCYLIHTTYSTSRKKIVPCGLLQSYAVNSMRRNAAVIGLPSIGLVAFASLCAVFK